GGRRLVVADAGEMAPGDLRQLALDIRNRRGAHSLVVVGARNNGKGAQVAAATPDQVEAGLSAGAIAGEGAAALGRAGTRVPARAQAGGPQGDQLDRALDIVREEASRRLRG